MTYIAVPTDWDLVCRDLVPTLRQEDRILETRSTKSRRGAEEAQKRRALNKPPAANHRHPSTTTYHLSTSEQHNKQPSNSNVAQDHPVDTYPSLQNSESTPSLPAIVRVWPLKQPELGSEDSATKLVGSGVRGLPVRSAPEFWVARTTPRYISTRANLVRCGWDSSYWLDHQSLGIVDLRIAQRECGEPG